jgi:hypothetical protein
MYSSRPQNANPDVMRTRARNVTSQTTVYKSKQQN